MAPVSPAVRVFVPLLPVLPLFSRTVNRVLSVRPFGSMAKMDQLKAPFCRLPGDVVPRHYDLRLEPDLVGLTFRGEARIRLAVRSSPNKIVFNCLDLKLDECTLKYEGDVAGSEVISPAATGVSVAEETATLSFTEPLPEGEAMLTVSYSGEINDKMKGLYRSKYTSLDGEERYAAVTQFEATDARRCFPCWDEPAIKATFDVTLVVPEDRVALSNMPEISRSPDPKKVGHVIVRFATTPIMSTYLVAVVVGEFDRAEAVSADGVLVRVHTPLGKRDQGLFALEVAAQVLPYYKDYFKIAYPLPKIDLVAIADFSAGAMENWGLVTYRETCLLVDPLNTSANTKQWVALVVGHELAHQWFGNLVTMEWWTHLWLNEGYATFVEYLCVDKLFPEYDIWTQFVAETHLRALELDCLKNSHPIEVPVGHPSEIDEIFDDISYSKGASVIRMLHRYIGDEDFRKGMQLYLTKHQYKNTFTEDLWEALESASDKPVGAIMSTWTKQMGFPLVRVESRQVGNDRVLALSQEKFCADGRDTDSTSMWTIPISISSQKDPEKIVLTTVLKVKSQEVTVPGISEDEWIKLNPGTVGFYRVQYSSNELSRLVAAVRRQALPPLDRLGLLVDLFAMVQAGHTPMVESLKLMEAFSEETNFTVWVSIVNCLNKISVILTHTDLEKQWKYFCRKLLGKVTKRLGWDAKPGETHLDTLLRSLVLNRMILYEDSETIEEAKRRFEHHISGSEQLPPDLRSACYKGMLINADEATFNKFLDLYRSAELHEEKDRIGRALGAMKDIKLLERVLQFSLTDDVRAQDTVFMVGSIAYNSTGIDLSWKFFKDNWELLIERYQGGFLLSRLVKSTTENFASEKAAQEVEAFFKDHFSPGAERTVQQSVETIRLNAAWLQRDFDSTNEFLLSYE